MKDDTLHAVATKSLRRRMNRRQFSIEIEKIDTSQAKPHNKPVSASVTFQLEFIYSHLATAFLFPFTQLALIMI